MSLPTLVTTPDIEEPIVVATPFSYTIKSTNLLPGALTTPNQPVYTFDRFSSQNCLTIGQNTSAGTDQWLTNFTINSAGNSPNQGDFAFYGTSYDTNFIKRPFYFEIQIPWFDNPFIPDDADNILFGPFLFKILGANLSDATRVLNYYINGVLSGTIDYTYANRKLYFSVGIEYPSSSGMWYNFANNDVTGFYPIQLSYSILIYASFMPQNYEDLTELDPNTYNISEYTVDSAISVYYNLLTSYHACIQTIPASYQSVLSVYGPFGGYNYEYWFPILAIDLFEELWISNKWYVPYQSVKVIVSGNTRYYQVKSTANPSFDEYPPDNSSVWTLLSSGGPPFYDWDNSTQYTPGTYVQLVGQGDPPDSGWPYYLCRKINLNRNPSVANYVYWAPIPVDITNTFDFTIKAPSRYDGYYDYYPRLTTYTGTSSELLQSISGDGTTELMFSSQYGLQSVTNQPLQLVVLENPFFSKQLITDFTEADPNVQSVNGFVQRQIAITESGFYRCFQNLPSSGTTLRTYGPDGAYNFSKYWPVNYIPGDSYWDELVPYVTDELVIGEGNPFYYVAIQDSKGQNPLNNPSYWTQLNAQQIQPLIATWNLGSSYVKGIYVLYNGNYYLTRSAISANTIPTDPNFLYWNKTDTFDLTGTDPYVQNVNGFIVNNKIEVDSGIYNCIRNLPSSGTTLRNYGPDGPYNSSKYWFSSVFPSTYWDELVPYVTDELVGLQGDPFYYVAIQDSKGQNPLNNSLYWTQITEEQASSRIVQWNSGSSYAKGIYVLYNGNYYLTRSAVPANTIPTNPSFVYWATPNATDLTGADPNVQDVNGFIEDELIEVDSGIYRCIQNLPSSGTTLRTYGPDGVYNFSKFWKVSIIGVYWDAAIPFVEDELISFDGPTYYIAVQDNQGQNPVNNPSYWTQINQDQFNERLVGWDTYTGSTIPKGFYLFYPTIDDNSDIYLTRSIVPANSIPTDPNYVYWIPETLYFSIPTTTYDITSIPFTITTTPTLTSPLSLVTYQPFEYTFSIPSSVVNVLFRYNPTTTSSSLIPYIVNGATQNQLDFRSTIGLTTSGSTQFTIEAILNNATIASSNTSVITQASLITITPSISTSSLTFYKYEPFSYVFTTQPNARDLVFQFNRSSTELQSFFTISGDLQRLTFSGSFAVAYTTTLNLIVDLVFGTTIIDSKTFLVNVGQGRFFPPSPNQNFQLYQYENLINTFGSNIMFSTVSPMTSIISTPSLPSGLTFGGSCNSFYIQGKPLLEVGQSNYQIIGTNSSNGRIVTSTISLRVNPSQVVITPASSSLTGLTIGTDIQPITTTALQPDTIYSKTFAYTWTSLPDGLVFQDINGNNVTQPFIPLDNSSTIVLTGTPTNSFASLMTMSYENLYQTRLTGTQTDQYLTRTIGTSLFNFSLGETVLVTGSNSVPLYRNKPLGISDVLITAESFFGGNATIESLVPNSLPPGLSLVKINISDPTRWRLSGTPTEVNLYGSYTFTATNTSGILGSATLSIPVNSDVVTFGGSTPANGTAFTYVVSKTITPIVFSATTSTANTITYSTSISLETYGLIFNTSTGTLSGTPTIPLSSTTITITATNTLGTTATTTIQLVILQDVFTWPTYSPTYFQNKPITPFQFTISSTLSGRSILYFSSGDLPSGMVINSNGLLSGTPTTESSGSFTITATTGFTLLGQTYSYSMIADQLLIVQDNPRYEITKVFSGIQYRAIQYSSDSFVNATFSINPITLMLLPPGVTLSITPDGIMSGDFTAASVGIYSIMLNVTYDTFSLMTTSYINITSVSGSGTGTIYMPVDDSLSFSQPTQISSTLFQYVPYSIVFQLTGNINPSEYIYYFSSSIPTGFQLIKDTPGVRTATLTGISPTLSNRTIIVYAKIGGGSAASISVTLRTITPFFVNPQSGAGAYTALLRNDVEANAAQNARDNRTFPQVDPLAGPLMAPRAPDVTTPNDCQLRLCKKPCPTCHTMM